MHVAVLGVVVSEADAQHDLDLGGRPDRPRRAPCVREPDRELAGLVALGDKGPIASERRPGKRDVEAHAWTSR